MMWNFWSVYMSGELKSASNRGRQLSIMFGALLWDGILLIAGALLLFRIVGYNFVFALNSGPDDYKIPSGPFYHFLAALVFNNPILTIIIVGSFLFWSLPSMIANTFMPIRSFFAWSFDRLMPEKLAEVNERTHSPVPAIIVANVIIALLVVWSVYSSQFQTLLGFIVLCGVLAVIIVGVAAIAFPMRRPDLYKASPANVSFLGVPVLVIAGGLLDRVLRDHGLDLAPVPGPRDGWRPGQRVVDPRVLHRRHRPRRAPVLRAEVRAVPRGDRHRLRVQGVAARVIARVCATTHRRPVPEHRPLSCAALRATLALDA